MFMFDFTFAVPLLAQVHEPPTLPDGPSGIYVLIGIAIAAIVLLIVFCLKGASEGEDGD